MLNEIFKMMVVKSIGKDAVVLAAKQNNRGDDILKDKLGVSSIDEFMKMDVRNYGVKK